jgi:hypothetical protein
VCQSPCDRKVDKNGFSLSETDIFCELTKNAEIKHKPIGNFLNNFDVQSLGSDSNSWVLRFRDRFGKVRSLVISNLEKSRKLFSIPRKIFGNFDEVIGGSNWNPKSVKDNIEKLLTVPKKVDFGVKPPPLFSFTDTLRSISMLLKPKKFVINELKKNAESLVSNKKRISENKERLGKSMKSLGMNRKLVEKVYDPKYLELVSKINQFSNSEKNGGKQSEINAENFKSILENLSRDKNSSELSISKLNKNFSPKQQHSKSQSTKIKNMIKSLKTTPKYTELDLTELIPSETDKHLIMGPTFETQSLSSPPLKRVPLSATIIKGQQNQWANKVLVPKFAPPTPMISPTSVLLPPIDFAQTILPEPTSDMDTFTYRDAIIAEDNQQFMLNDEDLKLFAQI